ncbi:MAG: hypothetical protein AB1641_04600 [Thermodesulfobacteriota bacterium]
MSPSRPRKLFVLASAVLVLLAGLAIRPPSAQAHKVYLFAWVEGDTVHTDSYFSKSSKVKQGKIKVYNPAGQVILEGLTDEQGAFSFQAPGEKGDLRLEVEAGSGHKGEFTLKAEELPAPAGPSETKASQARPAAPVPAGPLAAAVPGPSAPVDLEQIKKVVEQAVDARIKPLAASIAQLKKDQGPGFTEIVGGLGYIFGLLGLAMYFRRPKP